MTFSDKIKRSREIVGLTQQELADAVGISKRAVAAYESEDAKARRGTIVKLAKALKVSVTYLLDDTCTDPLADIEKDDYVEEARQMYGYTGARDVDRLLQDNAALFAGGELSDEDQLAFLTEMQQLFLDSKQRAKKFTPKRYLREDGDE